MGQRNIKKTRKIARETAQQYALDTHLETIRQYIDGIIELPYWKRRRVCRSIMKKHNPFGGNSRKRKIKKGGTIGKN